MAADSKSVPTWQLIPFFEASGAVQMALDAWLLEQHLQGLCPPTLRFYSWTPAAISLGYHQKDWPEHWAGLKYQGQPLDLVRRPTGGRAVLHQGDLTYALVASQGWGAQTGGQNGSQHKGGFIGKRTEVYRQVCEFLVVGWRSLGFSLRYGNVGRGYIRNPNCFGSATGADLVLDNGAKLIGSAQLWRAGGLLQHGSMRLEPDADLLKTVFETEAVLPDLPASLGGESGQAVLIEALIAAAQDVWGVVFERRELSEAEWIEVRARAAQFSQVSRPPVHPLNP